MMDWKMILLRIVLAIGIGTFIGVEREYKNRPAGMRTHVLVCLGACVIALIESHMHAQILSGAAGEITYNFGRMTAQVISGVGFLGAGTIFTAQKKITGLTTAASLWNAACLGIAIGYGLYFIAIAGAVSVMATLLMLQKIVHVNTSKRVEITFYHRIETIEFLNSYFDSLGVQVADIDFHVENQDGRNLYTNIYTLHMPSKISYADLVNRISEHENILGIRTTNT